MDNDSHVRKPSSGLGMTLRASPIPPAEPGWHPAAPPDLRAGWRAAPAPQPSAVPSARPRAAGTHSPQRADAHATNPVRKRTIQTDAGA